MILLFFSLFVLFCFHKLHFLQLLQKSLQICFSAFVLSSYVFLRRFPCTCELFPRCQDSVQNWNALKLYLYHLVHLQGLLYFMLPFFSPLLPLFSHFNALSLQHVAIAMFHVCLFSTCRCRLKREIFVLVTILMILLKTEKTQISRCIKIYRLQFQTFVIPKCYSTAIS